MPTLDPPAGASPGLMLIVGVHHRDNAAARLSDVARRANGLLDTLRSRGPDGPLRALREFAVLSTCGRVELYVVAEPRSETEVAAALRWEVFDESPGGPDPTLYEHRGVAAVRHLCRVAAGLDSMVIGEHQIAGQVARAFRDRTMAPRGSGVLQAALTVARKASRRVRSETEIGRRPASVGSVALDLARERLGGLEGRNVVLVGAGKLGRSVCRTLSEYGSTCLTVVSRSSGKAREIAAELGVSSAPMSALTGLLTTADLVVTATASEHAVIGLRNARLALGVRERDRPPLILFDLALPPDVDPAVGALSGLRLFTLEDVKLRVEQHIALRRKEAEPAEAIVDEVMDELAELRAGSEIETFISDLRRDFEALRSREVERWLSTHRRGSGTSREELDQLTRSLVNKLFHGPLTRLRCSPAATEQGGALLDTARRLFVPEPTSERAPAPASD